MNSMKELIDTVVNEVADLKILIMNGEQIDLEGRQNRDCYPVGYVRHTDNEMHLGNDIWLPVHLYDTAVVSCKTASKFVKYMAIAIFGIRTLKDSSISGKVSNRNIKSKPNEIPRPPLDSKKIGAIKKILRFWMLSINKTEEECDLQEIRVSKYIASKIYDLRIDQTEKKQHKKRSHKGKGPLNSSLPKQGISAHNEPPETPEAAHERQEEAGGFQYDDEELHKADSDISQHLDTSEEEEAKKSNSSFEDFPM
ncbi:BEN domain-containing protein 5-like isoform X1 [Temnothorax curvispinosus]|uniref:BEN domain-containing protein 5-like isoform X1 n=1 Tax=Temnothorax curvispinosus TaxID=300111 RepID=A0A6J1RAF9_9HYME|nr:BEN domain-containing protein 5-like isoform X1 [Temnothorax curvispinosus]